jgi:membrane-associated phospholipid phosphatase
MVFKENLKDISSFGGLPLYIFVSLLFLFLGFIGVFYQLIIALFLVYVIFFVVRSIYFKERPKKVKYKNWLEKIDANSFPSAHALRATILGLIIISFFNNNYINLLILFTILLEGFMRVKLKQHFWSDVIFGWIFGALIWLLIFRFF